MTEIPYEIIRSSRKTMCISIRYDKVTVHAPTTTSLAKIQDFVNKKGDWINKHLIVNSALDELKNYKSIYVKGVAVPLIFGGVNQISQSCVTVKSLASIKQLYIRAFHDEFMEMFNQICQSTGLSADKVVFKSYKAMWGNCDINKRIIFNYKLLMLPTELWQCVIIHELCHTVFMDHSKSFHALTRTLMPCYDRVHKNLKYYGCVLRLYR